MIFTAGHVKNPHKRLNKGYKMNKDTSLTPQEVADILKIAKTTVYELIKRGELQAYHIGRKVRVDLKDVEAYKNHKKKSTIFETAEQPQPHDEFISVNSDSRDSTRTNSRTLIISGQDLMLDILCRYLEMSPAKIKGLRSYHGSYNGLYAMYQGEVDAAGVHLWDGDTDTYNLSYVKSLVPGIPCTLIHLACRNVGFYVQKGNPKKIKGWSDLLRSDLTVLNREKGAGVRVLLDEKLRKMKVSSASINGYQRESQSHLAAASIISQRGADVSIGNEKAAQQVQGIEFIPLQTEKYELAVKTEDFNTTKFKVLFDIINSEDFRNEISTLGGYDLANLGKITGRT